MDEHTPGPWTVMGGAYEDAFVEVYSPDTRHLIARVFPREDAALIAAAPDLLAALEEIAESVRVTRATAEAIGRLSKDGEDAMQSLEVLADIARAAIAKVKGFDIVAP